MFIDSHAHLNYPDFRDSVDEVIKDAEEAGVQKIINVGSNLKESRESIRLSERYAGKIYSTVGIHPHDAGVLKEDWEQELIELAKDKNVVAVGEIGLDFFYENTEKEVQIEIFKKQIQIANEFDLPLVIHSRDAEKETLEILRSFNSDIKAGVVHCFTGSESFLKELLELGYYIGFTGIITFKKAEKLLELVSFTPLDRILVETDAPFLAPEPFRGKTNQPSYVIEVAKKIASVKRISLSEVEKETAKNTQDLFHLL